MSLARQFLLLVRGAKQLVREQYLPWCVFSYILDNLFAISNGFYASLERLALAAKRLAQKLWSYQGCEAWSERFLEVVGRMREVGAAVPGNSCLLQYD